MKELVKSKIRLKKYKQNMDQILLTNIKHISDKRGKIEKQIAKQKTTKPETANKR